MSTPFPDRPTAGHFHFLIQQAAARRQLVIQPDVGFSSVDAMGSALACTAATKWPTVGTLHIDSLTRIGLLSWVERTLSAGGTLNGYPLVSVPPQHTQAMIAGVPALPIQVRHGSAHPEAIFSLMQAVGLTAADGGPLSHCLAHGRTQVRRSIGSWRLCVEQLATWRERGIDFHLESHGGCLGGLPCPPSLRVALSLLEAIFFMHHGIDSLSLSYAQGPNVDQDLGALTALRKLASIYIPTARYHTVVHTYMGPQPQTQSGLRRLIDDAAMLACRGGAARLVVRPRGAPHPEQSDIEQALVWAMQAASTPERGRQRRRESSSHPRLAPHTRPREASWGLSPRAAAFAETIAREACSIIEATRSLHHNIDHALELAVANGLIDIPGCLHPQNRGLTAMRLDRAGALQWVDTGRLPFPADLKVHAHTRPSATTTGRIATEVPTRYDRLYGMRERLLETAASSSSRMLLQ